MDTVSPRAVRFHVECYPQGIYRPPPVLTFRYPTTEPARPGYVHPQVKLELGSLTDQRPIGNHAVTPWVAEEFPAPFAAPACRVDALEIERTFWEKATILHTEYHRPANKPMRNRLSRDCYDVCCMAAHPAGQRAMEDLDLLAHVVCDTSAPNSSPPGRTTPSPNPAACGLCWPIPVSQTCAERDITSAYPACPS